MKQNKNSGFTLVELAIVLVIIGLIVGGVLAGSSLIRNAEMRAVIQEKEGIEAAIHTFRTRYNAIPGDMRDATRIWGGKDPDPATCFTTPTTDMRTCNGNGNKRIWDIHTSTDESAEVLLVWQHLSNAGLIKSSLSGTPASGGGVSAEIGVNTPTSKISEATSFIEYLGNATEMVASGETELFPIDYSQIWIFGTLKPHSLFGNMPIGPVFTTTETYALDLKMDDGRPATGILKTWAPTSDGRGYDNSCATTNDPQTTAYNLDLGLECVLILKLKI